MSCQLLRRHVEVGTCATVAHIEYNSPPLNQGCTQIRARTNLGSSVTCREPPLLRVLRAAYFVFCSIFITTFVFSDSLCTYVTVPIDAHITLPICLSSSSVYIFIRVIHVYVYVNSYTHFPPSPRTFMFVAAPPSLRLYIFTFMYILLTLHTYPLLRIHMHLSPSIPMYLYSKSCVYIFAYSCNNLYPLYPHKYVLMCVCVHQDCSK